MDLNALTAIRADGSPEHAAVVFWAKTTAAGHPGVSVQAHCVNVGCVAEAIIATLPATIRNLLPNGAATLAALHDVGKITIGFQAKCAEWMVSCSLPLCSKGEIVLSVTDHATVSQYFLQQLPEFASARLWAVAVGAHHGRPKGKRIPAPLEALPSWANYRQRLSELLQVEFGPLPVNSPDAELAPHHSDLWLLAGLITMADWIGSNENWFSPANGLPTEEARRQANAALREIGWPGGKLRQTDFAESFASKDSPKFNPNFLQDAVANAAQSPGLIIAEGPMGCGKTEAALFAAQQLIEADLIECVLGLGPNLFYNSPMEACVVICHTAKPKARRGKILLINAINEVTRERAQSFLTDDHIKHIVKAYEKFADDPGFARVVTLEEIRAKDGNLSIPLYVAPAANGNAATSPETTNTTSLPSALTGWLDSAAKTRKSLQSLLMASND
jgi:CRISPR-associated endonuclease Cas3-HD